MTLVSFVQTTESYVVPLVTINQQTLYDSCLLSQDYGIIRGLPMNHRKFANRPTAEKANFGSLIGLVFNLLSVKVLDKNRKI